jgi:hypothetical protein
MIWQTVCCNHTVPVDQNVGFTSFTTLSYIYLLQACKYALRQASPLLGGEKTNTMIHDHLIDAGNLHYPDFVADLVKTIVISFKTHSFLCRIFRIRGSDCGWQNLTCLFYERPVRIMLTVNCYYIFGLHFHYTGSRNSLRCSILACILQIVTK